MSTVRIPKITLIFMSGYVACDAIIQVNGGHPYIGMLYMLMAASLLTFLSGDKK